MVGVRRGNREVPERPAHAHGQMPRSLVVPAVVGAVVLVLPLAALVSRIDGSVSAGIATSEVADALILSAVTALITTVVCLLIGGPLAFVIARAPHVISGALRALAVIALILPPVAAGLGVRGVLGPGTTDGWLDAIGLEAPVVVAIVCAQTAVSLPVLVLVVDAALRAVGRETEFTAASLGAGRWRVLSRVTLPAAGPGIVAAVLLCFARAIGEFGATAVAAPGGGTAPVVLFAASGEAGAGFAAALSLVMLVLAVLVAIALRAWWSGETR